MCQRVCFERSVRVFGVCETFGQHLHLVVQNGTTCEENGATCEVCSKMKEYNKKFQIAFFYITFSLVAYSN